MSETFVAGVGEPSPLEPPAPRYTELTLPAYRFVPGLNPHPRMDPHGHAVVRELARVEVWHPEEWPRLEPWLYAVDLYNQAYWWECHEVLEGLWRAAGRTTEPASFAHGVLHAAAANLHRHRGSRSGAERQAQRALARLASVLERHRTYMGVDLTAFADDLRACFLAGSNLRPSPILLEWGGDTGSGRRHTDPPENDPSTS